MSRMKPYKQGSLSGACGLYAVINAMSYCLDLDETEAEALYMSAMRHVLPPWDKTNGRLARALLIYGFNEMEMEIALLERLARKRLEIQQPFKSVRVSNNEVRRTIRAHVKGKRSCAIIKFNHSEGLHWTVVHKVRNGKYHLLDSAGFGKTKRMSKFADWHRRDNGLFAIHPPSVMLLTPAK